MKKRSNRWIRLVPVAVVAAVAVVSGCAPPGADAEDRGGGTGPIKLAVIDAQSGQMSSLGNWDLKGIKLAVDQANEAGGINGRTIELSVYDDKGDPTVGTNLARKVVSNDAVAVFASTTSGVSLAVAPIFDSAEIPQIAAGTSPDLARTGSDFLFLNTPTSETFDQTLARYVVEGKGYSKIAMITNNGAYGKGEHDAFLEALQKLGVEPVADQIVTPDRKNFSAALTKIRQAQPEVLFIGAEEVQTGLIVKQARQLGIDAVIAGGAPVGTNVYVETAGAANAEGTIVSTPYLGNDTDAQSKEFAKAYEEAYGEVPEMHGAKAYDGATIVIQALKETDVATGAELAEVIRGTDYEGLMGDFNFDENGVGIHQTKSGVITDGKLVPIS